MLKSVFMSRRFTNLLPVCACGRVAGRSSGALWDIVRACRCHHGLPDWNSGPDLRFGGNHFRDLGLISGHVLTRMLLHVDMCFDCPVDDVLST